jgi:hypothetical protein
VLSREWGNGIVNSELDSFHGNPIVVDWIPMKTIQFTINNNYPTHYPTRMIYFIVIPHINPTWKALPENFISQEACAGKRIFLSRSHIAIVGIGLVVARFINDGF